MVTIRTSDISFIVDTETVAVYDGHGFSSSLPVKGQAVELDLQNQYILGYVSKIRWLVNAENVHVKIFLNKDRKLSFFRNKSVSNIMSGSLPPKTNP